MTTLQSVRAIRVLHVGAGRYAPQDRSHSTLAIWRELARGFDGYTVVGRSLENRAATFVEGPLRVELLPSRVSSEAEFLFSQRLAVRVGRSTRPDVVVAQCPVLGGLAAAWLARREGCRVLMEFHGVHYFQDNPAFSRGGLVEQITRLNLDNADRIRVLTEGMKMRLLERFGSRYENRAVVLPPRVDLQTFSCSKESYASAARPPRLIMVGGVNENKGQLRFLRTVLSSKLDPDVWIVGTGPQLPQCQAYVDEAGAGERVRFFGKLTHDELAQLLPQADVFVQFSRVEATPRAILEAMAAGLPVLATNVGFCGDVVLHGETGFLLETGSTDEVAQYLGMVIRSEDLRARLGRAGRARVQREFGATMLYDRYRQLIAETAHA